MSIYCKFEGCLCVYVVALSFSGFSLGSGNINKIAYLNMQWLGFMLAGVALNVQVLTQLKRKHILHMQFSLH